MSYCRLVKCAKESAGQRYGTAGKKIGHASLTWAFSEAVVLLLRNKAQSQKYLARWEKKHGQGTALTVLAHKLARAVYYMLLRDTVFEMDTCLNGYGSRAGEPAAELDTHGISLHSCPGNIHKACVLERERGHRRIPLIPRCCLDTCSGSFIDGDGRHRFVCCPSPDPVTNGRTRRVQLLFSRLAAL
jgi:hypothetical protein